MAELNAFVGLRSGTSIPPAQGYALCNQGGRSYKGRKHRKSATKRTFWGVISRIHENSFYHLDPGRRRHPFHRPPKQADCRQPGGQNHHRLRPGGGAFVRSGAEPGADHRPRQDDFFAPLDSHVVGRGRKVLGRSRRPQEFADVRSPGGGEAVPFCPQTRTRTPGASIGGGHGTV